MRQANKQNAVQLAAHKRPVWVWNAEWHASSMAVVNTARMWTT